MDFADGEVAAADAALEDREVVLDGVGMPESAPHIFFRRIVDGAVAGEGSANLRIDRASSVIR